MVATCPNDYSGGFDSSKNSLEQTVARDLDSYLLRANPADSPKRAACIREYMEWLLDDSRNLETKKNAGFLKPEYQATLVRIVEEMLSNLNQEHGESHPEFPMLRYTMERFRRNITTLLN